MTSRADVQAWVARTEDDFILARAALRLKTPVPARTCFHAQQGAEKYPKALLVDVGASFPRTHDLVALKELCRQAGIPFRVGDDRLDAPNAYAVQIRYPGVTPTMDEARRALTIARAVRRAARRLLNLAP